MSFKKEIAEKVIEVSDLIDKYVVTENATYFDLVEIRKIVEQRLGKHATEEFLRIFQHIFY